MPRINAKVDSNGNACIYMVKESKVKEFVKVGGMRVASDFYDALNIVLGKLIIKACVSAKEDDRATIRPSDLDIKTNA